MLDFHTCDEWEPTPDSQTDSWLQDTHYPQSMPSCGVLNDWPLPYDSNSLTFHGFLGTDSREWADSTVLNQAPYTFPAAADVHWNPGLGPSRQDVCLPVPNIAVDSPVVSSCGSEASVDENCSVWEIGSSTSSLDPVTRRHGSSPDNGAHHVCKQCRLAFKSPGHLEQHAKAAFHRTYLCPEAHCSKSFYRRDTYVRHVSTHRQTKLHSCKTCAANNQKAMFKRRDHLKQHQRNCHPGLFSAANRSGQTRERPLFCTSHTAPEATVVSHRSHSSLCGGRHQTECPRANIDGECCLRRLPRVDYDSQPMKDIASALGDRLGDQQEEVLCIIAEQLDLHRSGAM